MVVRNQDLGARCVHYSLGIIALGPLGGQSLEVLVHVGILTHAHMHIFIITLSVWVYVCMFVISRCHGGLLRSPSALQD